MLTKKNILIIGTSEHARRYYEFFKFNPSFDVTICGRNEVKTKKIAKEYGFNFILGDFTSIELKNDYFSVCVNVSSVDSLFDTTKYAILHGIKNILIEKPGAIKAAELVELNKIATEYGAYCKVAYNRRYISSIRTLKSLTREFSEISSFEFDFSENESRVLSGVSKSNYLPIWGWLNSSHIIDLFFYCCGKPVEYTRIISGKSGWHESGSIFIGAGKSERGIPFSYHSTFKEPSRWRLTARCKDASYFLEPIEHLIVQKQGTFTKSNIDLVNNQKVDFSLMIKEFLENVDILPSLNDVLALHKFTFDILGYANVVSCE
jgi:predicted dehydrogenase